MKTLHSTLDSNVTAEKLLQQRHQNQKKTGATNYEYDRDQYVISSFRPERQSWSSHEPIISVTSSDINSVPFIPTETETETETFPGTGSYQTHFTESKNVSKVKIFPEEDYQRKDFTETYYQGNRERSRKLPASWDQEIANHRQYDIVYSDNSGPGETDYYSGTRGGQFYDSSGEIIRKHTEQTHLDHNNKHIHSRFHKYNPSITNQRISDYRKFHSESYPRNYYQRPDGRNHYQDKINSVRRGPSLPFYDDNELIYEDSDAAFTNHISSSAPGVNTILLPPDRQINNLG